MKYQYQNPLQFDHRSMDPRPWKASKTRTIQWQTIWHTCSKPCTWMRRPLHQRQRPNCRHRPHQCPPTQKVARPQLCVKKEWWKEQSAHWQHEKNNRHIATLRPTFHPCEHSGIYTLTQHPVSLVGVCLQRQTRAPIVVGCPKFVVIVVQG